ncbi:MAG TPA: phosphate signaling complex protein PhoU [Acidimicrobiia bacterium]|nr:phosphate signaling complex protein PhoU [Acidimicrobiia bacterium]
MTEVRSQFHADMEALETRLVEMAERASDQISEAVASLISGDVTRAETVVASDEEIDRIYLEIENRWHEIMARQTPVASDLRRMTLILSANHSVERIGDQSVNIAEVTRATEGLPRREPILLHIREMCDLVVPMLGVAVEALVKRDLSLALRLPEMDEPVDLLNRNMYREVADCGPDHDLLEWAVRMMLVARALERVGDRAVDIAEQVAFLLTGVFREFSHDNSIHLDAT